MQTNRSARSCALAQRATLHLTRGLSTHVGWVLRGGGNSSVITIGAGSSCDWQIHAPGLPSHAMSIGFIDGHVCAAAGPDAYVTVGGNPLSEAWTKVAMPAAFQLGAARLELSWSDLTYEDPSAEEDRVTLTDASASDSAAHAFGDDGRLPSLFDGRARPNGDFTLARVAGFLLLMATSYFAWLVLLDHV